MRNSLVILIIACTVSCKETVNNNKEWLLKQDIVSGFVFGNDSIDNISFNFDTNELKFSLNIKKQEIIARDKEIANFWIIDYNGNVTTFTNLKNIRITALRKYNLGKYEYLFNEN
jgi:hypothetical protein